MVLNRDMTGQRYGKEREDEEATAVKLGGQVSLGAEEAENGEEKWETEHISKSGWQSREARLRPLGSGEH